jgi:predicted ATPase
MLRTFCAAHSSDELSRYLGASASELVKLLPELVMRLPELVPAPTLEPQQEKHRLFESLGQFFSGLAAHQPVLVVVEDLRWSDETSLECLLRLAHRVASQPIFLLGTYRTDEVNSALTHFLVELDRGRLATELVLSRLSLDEVEAMLRAIFELNRPIRTEFLKTIYAQSEGNPFFIEEILKSLIMAGVIFFAGGTWDRKPMAEIDIPRSAQEAVRRRVERVSRLARQTLTLAAVAGKVVSFSLLEELSGMSESELTEQIEELVAAQLLVAESADRFSFRHALGASAFGGQRLRGKPEMQQESRRRRTPAGERRGINSLAQTTKPVETR